MIGDRGREDENGDRRLGGNEASSDDEGPGDPGTPGDRGDPGRPDGSEWDDPPGATVASGGSGAAEPAPVHITADLLALLLERADAADPDDENVVLDATAAGDLIDAPTGLDPTTPVLTHFYFPGAGGSVSAVFGMDLGRPAGRARFLSHPDADRRLTERDDLAAAVLVAVPPYGREDVVAYDRGGRRRELVVVDAEPPEERVDDAPGG